MSKSKTLAIAAALSLAVLGGFSSDAFAVAEINVAPGRTLNGPGVAVHGYDPVAYFTEQKPAQGSAEFSVVHGGATYRFASAAHRDKFAADPAKYAPQYGGFCAFGTSVGRKFDGDPNAWRIIDGKLYLNLNKKIQARWLQDPEGYIRGANHNWPIIANLADAQLASNSPEGLTQGAI